MLTEDPRLKTEQKRKIIQEKENVRKSGDEDSSIKCNQQLSISYKATEF
jgi:hypothetical protein